MQNSKNSDKGQSWLQLPDGYLDKTPMFQFLLVCLIFPLWGAATMFDVSAVFTQPDLPALGGSSQSERYSDHAVQDGLYAERHGHGFRSVSLLRRLLPDGHPGIADR